MIIDRDVGLGAVQVFKRGLFFFHRGDTLFRYRDFLFRFIDVRAETYDPLVIRLNKS